MGQVSEKMRKTTHGLAWWCPGCDEMHPLPFEKGWMFDGNMEAPTFTPSFKHDWGKGKVCCHYVVTAGKIAYCGDCTHKLAGQTIDMPVLPEEYRDPPVDMPNGPADA